MKFPLRSAGLLLAVALCGCGPNTNIKTTGTGGGGGTAAGGDPWPKFVNAVRNNPDPKGTRAAVSELSAGLTNAPAADRPPAADPAFLDAVAAGLKLTDAEKKAVGGGEFTPLDANHLSECLYLFDVANTLGVLNADPVTVRATAAFRFVCRQVELAPAVIGQGYLPPVPPTFVLSRGSGSGLERAMAFVALGRQLDLDVYFIGPPDAADRPWTHAPAANQPPKGPFWAVGVRDKDGVLVFDPWRGEPVPGKVADRPVTLAELKADPAACPWAGDKANPWAVTADDIKAAGLFLSPPLSATSPRMARLQEKLKETVGVAAAVDWAAAVKTAEGAAGGAPVGGWNPKGDRYTPVRVLGSFLPLDQGGLDTTPEKDAMFVQYDFARLPMDRLLRTPVGVENPDAKRALMAMAAVAFKAAFLTTPTPREKIQRGQYNSAVSDLVKQNDAFAAPVRAGTAQADDLKDWYRGLNGAYNRASQAQGSGGEEAARAEADKFLRAGGRYLERAVGGMVAEAGAGEASYLLAVAAHEQAEAAEAAAVRTEREGGPTAAEARKAAKALWVKAANGWGRYAEYAEAQAASFPGRKANADAMAARAGKLAK